MLLKPKYDSLQALPLPATLTLDEVKAFLTACGVDFEFAGVTPDNTFVVHVRGAERTLLLPRDMMLVVASDNVFGADPRIVDIFYAANPANA